MQPDGWLHKKLVSRPSTEDLWNSKIENEELWIEKPLIFFLSEELRDGCKAARPEWQKHLNKASIKPAMGFWLKCKARGFAPARRRTEVRRGADKDLQRRSWPKEPAGKGNDYERAATDTHRRDKETAYQQSNLLPHTRETDRQRGQNNYRAGIYQISGIQSRCVNQTMRRDGGSYGVANWELKIENWEI